jgi:pimeloyl-ACP methyl ester carboxylesterase
MQRQTDGRRRTRLFSVPIRTVGALALLLGLMLSWPSGGSSARAVLARTHTGPRHGGQTGTITERATLQQLFSATTVQAAWFAPQFLAQVPLKVIQQLDDQLPRALGPFQGVIPVPYQSYYATYQQGLIRVTTIQLDAHGRILSLQINGRPLSLALLILQITGPKLSKDRVLIAGYHTYVSCQGTGRPTVVLESGLGDDSGPWGSVIPAIVKTTHVCFYDRASTGGSDARPGPRTSATIARELHALLTREGIAGPYILAGHSIAGYHMRVFASLYPSAVAGMVMVDSSHPDQVARFLEVLGPRRPNEASDVAAYRQALTSLNNPLNNPEHFDIPGSAAQVRAAGTLGSIPLVVLTAGHSGLPLKRPQPLEAAWRGMQEEMAGLSTDSVHVLMPKSGHYIQVAYPKAVIAAIQQVVTAVRMQGRLPACTTIFPALGGACFPAL